MIKCTSVESTQKDRLAVDSNGNMILTGWGHAECVASAAVALKALDVSRNAVRIFVGGFLPQRAQRR